MPDQNEIEIGANDEAFEPLWAVADLPSLKSLSGCPKCGETGTFCLKKEYCDDPDCSYDDEHLHVRCEKCGYSRDAKCADAPESCGSDANPAKADVVKMAPLEAAATVGGYSE